MTIKNTDNLLDGQEDAMASIVGHHHSGMADFSGVCAACATPPGQSGIAVIRLSGAGSDLAADQIFRPAGSRTGSVQTMPAYTCAFGQVIDPRSGVMIDQVVLTRFTAPHSYTGEDLIEISCHGGYAVKNSILELLYDFGITPAQPGEFTQRAFINGKLDLVQAEAVMDLIQAGAKKASAAAAAQLQGALSGRIRQIADTLYQVQAELELILEFPEHEDGDTAGHDRVPRLQALAVDISRLTASYRQGRMLREGLTVAIAGRPNVGKSSLLNALAGFDRAIVTPIPGTTRDTVEEIVDIDGLPVRLIDTAGMRDTTDLVEQHGVTRARAALAQADLVFWLISPPLQDLTAEKAEIEAAGCANVILIAGKEDLEESWQVRQMISTLFTDIPVLTFSALRSDGIDAIRQVISRYYEETGSGSSQDIMVTNSRHQACLIEASEALTGAVSAISQSVPLDMTAALLRGCAEALARLTGDTVSDTLVDTIFSRFCVGK